MPILLGFRNCSCVFRLSGISGAPAHPEPNIKGGTGLVKNIYRLSGGLNSTKNKRGPGPFPSSASDVVMNNMFLSISYQIMLDCWRENPVDRPTFERLRNTMKEMEGNQKVRRVRETIMDTEGSFREEANNYSRAEAKRSV